METLLAEDLLGDGRQAILKVSALASAGVTEQRRVLHEAEVLRTLHSASIAPLLAAGREGDLFYVALPLVPGVTLASRLSQSPLSVEETLAVGRSLLEALEEAHEHGVLHRDVKPANVIVSAAGPVERATLIDFGLAASGLLDASIRTQRAGTARYMSPEQAGSLDCEADERADLYSVGILLFECLAGRPPFTANTVGEVLRQHLTSQPPLLRNLLPHLPRVVDEVIQRLLRKDPRDRYQSAAGVAADLAEIARALQRGIAAPTIVLGAQDLRRTLTEPAFVGREPELATLAIELERAQRGCGGLVLLESKSGGGKTRMLEEFAHRSAQAGAWVLRGQGQDQVAQRPFQIVAGVAADILSAARWEKGLAEWLCQSLGERRDAACNALPELAEALGPAAAKSLGPESFGETRSLEALTALLEALGQWERPAVVLLDDGQWSDDLTLKLLEGWQRRLDPEAACCHLLVVIAFRSEEVAPEHSLRRLQPLAHLALPPLSRHELLNLVVSMAGLVPDEAFEAVARLSGGSPFMASAVLRGLVESGALVWEPSGWRVEAALLAELQASRRAAVFLSQRIRRLPPAALRLLTVGAVLGKEFDLDLAAALAGQAPEEAVAALAEARQRHIVWTRAREQRPVFVHDKLRETLLGLLSPEARRELHHLAAVSLEDHNPGAIFELAYHFDAAGEPERALPYALAAAEEARCRHALEIAERQYRIAERGGGSAGGPARLRVAEGLGDVLMLRGRYAEAAQQFEQARSLTEAPRDRAQLDGKLGELAFKRGDVQAASRSVEGALRLLRRHVPQTRLAVLVSCLWEVVTQALHTALPRAFLARRSLAGAEDELLAIRLYSRLAYVYWFGRGRIPCLWAHLREMNLAERFPPTLELAQAYSEHAPVLTMVPHFKRGIAFVEKSLAIRRALGDLWGQGQSLHFYGVVLYAASRFCECAEKCREAVRILERTGDRWEVNTASWHIAFCQYRLGDLEGAVDAARRSHQSGLEIGDHQASGISLGAWAKASAGKAPPELLRAELERASGDAHTEVEVLQAEALRLLGDRPQQAVEVLEKAQRLVRAAGLRQEYVAPVLPWLATALRHAIEATPAREYGRRRALLRRARTVVHRALRMARSYQNNLPHALRETAWLEAMRGRPERARKLFDQSLAVAERQGARHERAQSLLARAQLGVSLEWPGAADDEAAARTALQGLAAGEEPGDGRPGARRAEEATLSLADRFDALLEAGRRITTALSQEVIFGSVREAALTLLRGERCVVVKVTKEGGSPRRTTGDGGSESDEPISHSLVQRALELGRPVTYTEELALDAGDTLVLLGVRSALCAPIAVRGQGVACFEVTHGQVEGLFGAEEERIAQFIAALAGAALENAESLAALAAGREAVRLLESDLAMRNAAALARLREEHLHLAQALRVSEERYRSLFEEAPHSTWVVDAETLRFLEVNRKAISHYGYTREEFLAMTQLDILPPEEIAGTLEGMRAVLAGEPRIGRRRHRTRSGQVIEVSVASRPVVFSGRPALLAVVDDVTERHRLEIQLRQAQKMEAVGQLAGGVAHDFNNLLTVILGYSSLLGAKVADRPELLAMAEEIGKSGERGAVLARQLLAFSRNQVLRPRLVDLNAVVAGVTPMLGRLISADVEFVASLQPALGQVLVDPSQIELVIVNLAINARDAMPEGGHLVVETADVELDAVYADAHIGVRPGSYVRLSVSDSGHGMDAETRPRIFEPFFTTKESGHGTGLGLAIVYGIVHQSGGRIEVYSEPGCGSSFKIYLPRAASGAEKLAAVAPAAAEAPVGSETVLVVEDDLAVRSLATALLKNGGYTVLAEETVEAAISLAERHAGPIHLVLTDVVMPGMSGPEVAERLAELRPKARLLYMSGYPGDLIRRRSLLPAGTAFLEKPFTEQRLLRKVREVLDASETS
ncbi:MAG TPA: ATP-binding protein [Thermoanaerobaculia bacterium]|nr:ATP-binding protein [Thermoanaerobaculia bacterium]